jgi:hypothetical protein
MEKHRGSARNAGSGRGVRRRQAQEPETIPRELAGRWIAWSADGLRIIGSGVTFKEAVEAAAAAGDPEAILERAPAPFLR